MHCSQNKCSIRDITPGVPGKACWGELYGKWPTFRLLLLCVKGKYRAALTPIQTSSIGLFNSGSSNSDFDTGQSGRLPPGKGGITIGEWSCRAS